MKKFFTLSLSAFSALVFTAMSYGQAVIFQDNFDSYTVGGQLACQNPTDWTTWSLAPCDANEDPYVSDLYAFSGSNSVVNVQNNDLVKTYGDLTSGKYSIAFMIYIPTGKNGIFSTMSGFTGGAYEWAVSVEFNPGGSGLLHAGGMSAATFTYAHDTWQSVKVIVDLDNDSSEFWFDGTMVYAWQWTLGSFGTGGALQLAASDFWSLSTGGFEMYIDNFEFWDMIIPVELTSFAATSQTGKVYLNWTTATELNNLGFEIERKILNNQNECEWVRIGFVEGHGTTTETKEYSYVDDINTIQASSLAYRLKQIDFLGSYEYSDEVFVDNPAPLNFTLHQNYPNPFNPATMITFGIPVKSNVVLKIFNSIGEEVAQLVNEEKPAGRYQMEFDATTLSSGVYFYRLQVGDFVKTKKMLLLK